jgi:hypothetical protein
MGVCQVDRWLATDSQWWWCLMLQKSSYDLGNATVVWCPSNVQSMSNTSHVHATIFPTMILVGAPKHHDVAATAKTMRSLSHGWQVLSSWQKPGVIIRINQGGADRNMSTVLTLACNHTMRKSMAWLIIISGNLHIMVTTQSLTLIKGEL